MNNNNILIGILITTAVILTGMIVVTQTADAGGAAASGTEVLTVQQPGQFIMGSATIDTDASLIYVIDANAMRMSVYYPNLREATLDQIDGVDLDKLNSFK
ncbi:MAG TPA: hypothetical protein ENL03_06060 [Phycisphaerae bacterium]|nr:hypothetical protein [Phycisphaerae bacterium]